MWVGRTARGLSVPKDLEISWTQSSCRTQGHRTQKLADIPQKEFDDALENKSPVGLAWASCSSASWRLTRGNDAALARSHNQTMERNRLAGLVDTTRFDTPSNDDILRLLEKEKQETELYLASLTAAIAALYGLTGS